MEKIDKITQKKYIFLDKQETHLKSICDVFNLFIEKNIPEIPKDYIVIDSFSEKEGVVSVRVKDPIFLNRLNTQKEYIKYKLFSFDNNIKDVNFIL